MSPANSDKPTLFVITGPTASGKSALALTVASRLHTEIISADSRQIYARIPITTAAPSPAEMAEVPHHLVGILPLDAYYSASCFREDAMRLAADIIHRTGYAVVCGGSMMYVDALCNGIDELPTVPESIRSQLTEQWQSNGDEWLLLQLKNLDPEYAASADCRNLKRVFHAVEVSIAAGAPYSSLLTGRNRQRAELPWNVRKIAIDMPRDALFDRINRRVVAMADAGMADEVRAVSHLRHLNSLNTVGIKEMLRYIDGEWTLQEALARMAKNTRVYAKKQLTWLKRDSDVEWISASGNESPESLADKIFDRSAR